MNTRRTVSMVIIFSFLFFALIAYGSETVKLPKPRIRGQLMKALKNRTSIKGFSEKSLSDKLLSDLLWSAYGINNPKSGSRTAPSAFNAQEIDIYVLSAEGGYLYNAEDHSLEQIIQNDIRNLVATQSYAKTAPIHFIYVADYDKALKRYPGNNKEMAESWAMMHTGFIGQNVHLFCSAKGLGAVVRSAGNEEQLRAELRLRDGQGIIISQAIGYPPKR